MQVVELSVLSWNIDSRRPGLGQRIERLGRDGWDLVLLQEVPRSAAAQLRRTSGLAWAELGVLHSEPDGGPSRRVGPAILGSERVRLREAGQVPAARFTAAGQRAGLSAEEVHNVGWRHKSLYADVEIDGVPLRVASFHARPGSSGLGLVKQLFHRVCAEWVAQCPGSLIFGVDANSPRVDHPDPTQWMPFLAGEATLIGPRPRHHLVDALTRWLDRNPQARREVLAIRPEGPLAVSYYTPRQDTPRRYDHLFVTPDFDVRGVTYRPPHADGSDHGAVHAGLTLDEPPSQPHSSGGG